MRNVAQWLNRMAIGVTIAFIAFAIGRHAHAERLSFPILLVAIAQGLTLARER